MFDDAILTTVLFAKGPSLNWSIKDSKDVLDLLVDTHMYIVYIHSHNTYYIQYAHI